MRSYRSPVISARTPTSGIDSAYVAATANNLAQPALVPAMLAAGIPAASLPTLLGQLLGAALTNVPAASLPPTLAPYAGFYPSCQAIAAGAGKLGLLAAAANGRYFVEYPEGINMFGASFNASRLTTAWPRVRSALRRNTGRISKSPVLSVRKSRSTCVKSR